MSTDLRPALLGSALVHAGVVLAGVWVWAEQPEPRKQVESVPVMLVSAPPGMQPAPETLVAAPEPAGPPVQELELSAPPPEPAPPEPAPPPPTPAPSPPQPSPVPQPRPTPAQKPAPAKPAPPATAPSKPSPPAPTKPAPPKTTPAKPSPPAPAAQPSLDLGALRNRLASNTRPAPRPSGPPASSAAGVQAAQAALGARLQELWRPNCEAEGGSSVNVRVRFHIGDDGRVDGTPEVVGGLSGDAVVRAAQDRAVRAVLAGQPYDWMPKEALGVTYAPRFNAEQACSA